MAEFSIYRKWRAFRSREFTQWLFDGTYPANTSLVSDRAAAETFLIEAQTVAVI